MLRSVCRVIQEEFLRCAYRGLQRFRRVTSLMTPEASLPSCTMRLVREAVQILCPQLNLLSPFHLLLLLRHLHLGIPMPPTQSPSPDKWTNAEDSSCNVPWFSSNGLKHLLRTNLRPHTKIRTASQTSLMVQLGSEASGVINDVTRLKRCKPR
ncbi:hypothetical protein ABVT39_026567 [Epinephelus coioides]